jgi:ABC-type uncharacterized transport system substrate-binding protein
VTGVTLLTNLMEPKRLGLLRDLAPGVPLIGTLINPSFPPSVHQLALIEEAARAISQPIIIAKASKTMNWRPRSHRSRGRAPGRC